MTYFLKEKKHSYFSAPVLHRIKFIYSKGPQILFVIVVSKKVYVRFLWPQKCDCRFSCLYCFLKNLISIQLEANIKKLIACVSLTSFLHRLIFPRISGVGCFALPNRQCPKKSIYLMGRKSCTNFVAWLFFTS